MLMLLAQAERKHDAMLARTGPEHRFRGVTRHERGDRSRARGDPVRFVALEFRRATNGRERVPEQRIVESAPNTRKAAMDARSRRRGARAALRAPIRGGEETAKR
nr:MAG: hypothetical protein DIU78_13575 [Pseudomonadota bacterium]